MRPAPARVACGALRQAEAACDRAWSRRSCYARTRCRFCEPPRMPKPAVVKNGTRRDTGTAAPLLFIGPRLGGHFNVARAGNPRATAGEQPIGLWLFGVAVFLRVFPHAGRRACRYINRCGFHLAGAGMRSGLRLQMRAGGGASQARSRADRARLPAGLCRGGRPGVPCALTGRAPARGACRAADGRPGRFCRCAESVAAGGRGLQGGPHVAAGEGCGAGRRHRVGLCSKFVLAAAS